MVYKPELNHSLHASNELSLIKFIYFIFVLVKSVADKKYIQKITWKIMVQKFNWITHVCKNFVTSQLVSANKWGDLSKQETERDAAICNRLKNMVVVAMSLRYILYIHYSLHKIFLNYSPYCCSNGFQDIVCIMGLLFCSLMTQFWDKHHYRC